MRIGQKLILGFVSVALLVGVVGYISVNTSRKALQKSIGENSVVLAQETLGKIDRNIHGRIEQVRAYAKDLAFEEVLIQSNEEFSKIDNIRGYINEKEKEWTSVPKETITPFMQALINNELSQEIREEMELTEFYKEKYGDTIFGEVFVTNKYGANVAQTNKTTDYRQDDEEWWQRAKKEGLFVGDVEYDRSAGIYSTDIGIRIDDENGNFLGVIKAVLNVEEVINIIKEVEASAKYKTSQLKLFTKDEKLIYSTEEYEILKDVSGVLACRYGHVEDPAHQLYLIDTETHGEEKLFAHAHSKGYRDYKGLDWILVIEYETKEIFTPITQLRNRLVIISLVVAMLAILMGFFISKAISDPLTKLRDAAIEIGKGNLDARIDVKSNDETGELAASIREMVGRLKESHKQLEEKVKERTAELSSTNITLEEEISARSSARKTLRQHIKQLNCLYGLSRLIVKQKILLEQIFQETPDLIRSAYRCPDATCVRITFEGIQYKTDNFEKSQSGQYAPIYMGGNKAGEIEVYYLGEKPESGRSPFLEEERALLDAVAENLGRTAERKRATETLRLFRNLIDRSNDSIFVMEPEWGRFLDVNDRACDSLGYTREELLNKSIKDVEESILDDSTWQEHVKKLKHKADLVIEGEHRRKDGTTFYVETSLRLVSREDKDYVIAVARDITERKHAEEKISRQSEFLRKTIESLGHPFYVINARDYTIAMANSAALPEGMPEKATCYMLSHRRDKPCDNAEHHCPLEEVKKTGEAVTVEHVHYDKDGNLRVVEVHAYPIFDSEGNISQVIKYTLDITERKQSEEKLKESEERTRAILNSVQAGVVIVDEESHNIVYANPAAARMVETTIENMVGNICHNFICPAEIGQCPISDLGQKVDNSKRILLKSSGEELHIFKTVTRFDMGGHRSLIETFVDINKLEQAEQKQAQLLKQLEAINDELKDFAYIVSHDLKAPLRGIKTLADWLVADYAGKLDDNGREQMNLLLSRVQRMHNLIDGVLQYSKVGRVKEEKGKVNLNDLVSEVIDTLTPPESLGITVEITVENQLPVIECEETRITQVFQNLLSNAIKYMDKPRGHIRIGCVEENGFWNFSVADNGPGIEEKHFERIFRIFQTLSPRDEFESTGVGLTIVKKIIELYGGKIWVESKLGEGSTFFFTLPNEEMGVRNAKLEANIVS